MCALLGFLCLRGYSGDYGFNSASPRSASAPGARDCRLILVRVIGPSLVALKSCVLCRCVPVNLEFFGDKSLQDAAFGLKCPPFLRTGATV